MSVRAKFKVLSVKKTVLHDGSHGATEVEMQPVYTGSPENQEWSEYTPNGSVKLTITKGDARNAFRPGEEFYVDFTKA